MNDVVVRAEGNIDVAGLIRELGSDFDVVRLRTGGKEILFEKKRKTKFQTFMEVMAMPAFERR